jgi:hypothetical protein
MSNDPRDASLPPRFRSSAFRRYEADLKLAVDNSPNEVVIDPKNYGLSLCTVEQRLRDARRSFVENHWPSSIDYEKYCQLCETGGLLIRACNDGMIRIGMRPYEFVAQASVGHVVSTKVNKQVLDPSANLADPFRLLAFLAQERALSRPLQLTLPPSVADELYASFDISLEVQKDGSYILT